MKTDYKENLIATIENIFKAGNPEMSTATLYAKMYGALSVIVTNKQLEELLELVMTEALTRSNTEK
jgi:hypothetical protein